MKVKEDDKHYFNGLEIGMVTDRGTIQDLFFLQFNSLCGASKIYEPKGKGIIMARVNGKDIEIGKFILK